MATGGIDIITLFLTKGDGDVIFLQEVIESKRIFIARGLIVFLSDFILRNQIDIGIHAFQQVLDLIGFLNGIIDAFQ